LLSFFVAMRQQLHLPQDLDGRVWRYANLASANRRHTHAELELNLVTRGLGVYLIGQRRYQIQRGDLLWLFPDQEHVLIEQTPDFRMWIAVFRRRAIRRVATDRSTRVLLKSDFDAESCRRLAQRDLERIETLLAEVASLEEPGLANAGIAYALARCWRAFQNATDVPVCDLHPAVERASRLMRDGGASLPLNRVARRAGLSPGRLSRLFHQQTGFTVVQFRNRQRLERFFAVYGSGQRRTMLDAALEAGFGSYAQFHRVFTEVMGCPPRSYRHRETI
jgi:AraC-like DNA-binding protein